MTESPEQRTARSPARRRLFVFISTSLPVMALVGIELLLRASGYGGYDPILREMGDTPYGKRVVTDLAGAQGFFFANPGRPGYSRRYSFYSPKDENTVRIVLVGASVIKGFPQTRRFAVSSFLSEMLSDAWPDRTVEVINLGTTAVASFPVQAFLGQALDYEPDLVVVYTGHNEFYGAYGVASSNQAGSTPIILKFQYHLRGLAIVQGLTGLIQRIRGVKPPSMMEIMVGQAFVEPDSWKREAAAGLLYEHVGSMIRMSRERGVAVMVCMLPSNERDLAPIGTGAGDSDVAGVVAMAKRSYGSEPDTVISTLTALLARRPDHARAHFYLGRAYHVSGDYQKAQHHFVQARDLDPMPWRATSSSQRAIRLAAQEQGAQICEAEAVFRAHSPGGSIGWELMDDHVHPSLQGQALLARTIVETLTSRSDQLGVSRQRFEALPGFNVYAHRLGDNPYDRYGVAHTLRTLFTVPFMQESNPEALRRFNKYALYLESRMAPAIRDIAWQWQKQPAHLGARQPISGMVARGMLGAQRYEEAEALFEVAQHSVPGYSSLSLEYVFYWLDVRRQLYGALTAADRDAAARAIARGAVLLSEGAPDADAIERHIESLQRLKTSADDSA